NDLLLRLKDVETRIEILQEEVTAIRLALRQRAAAPQPAAPPVRRSPFPAARPAAPSPARPAHAPRPAPPRQPRREIDLAALLGPKAFAWVGGVVTLLGVVFF